MSEIIKEWIEKIKEFALSGLCAIAVGPLITALGFAFLFVGVPVAIFSSLIAGLGGGDSL